MKRTIAIAALCAGIMLTTFPCQAKESGNLKINAKNFPDTIVREYVSEKIDKNNDGYLSKKEISAVKTIIIDKNNLYWENKEKLKEDYEIIDCKGLEIFTNVEKVKWVFPKPFNYDKLISVIREFSKNDITLELINSIVDDLLSKLRIPFSKGRRLLKVAIIVAYTRQNLLQKIEILMNTVAQRENYSNAKSIRSTIDKTIERTFNQANDNSIFYILDEYYGEKMTTKDFINSCVLHIRKTIKNS